ncbi:MAG: helix-turn-helix domain-containing protein, partial [Thiotrichaceae bacterium]|nr:helix-turn-helix domain-containing protein [Thiotrichaceae bacterium]
NANPLKLSPGYFFEIYMTSRETLEQGKLNTEYHCMYQLLPKSLRGYRQVLHLNTMQTSYIWRAGGLMLSPAAPKGSFIIAVFENCVDKACFGRMKLKTGDIIFFDDSYIYNFINSGEITFRTVMIENTRLGSFLPMISSILNHHIYDTDSRFASILHKIWKRYTEPSTHKKESEDFQQAEGEILAVLMELLAEQTPVIPKLTAGEKTALAIRNQVFHHMDGAINIQSLAEQHNISQQTLQNSFKSLFGFTPNFFLRTLKLNHVHQELAKSSPGQTTVSQLAYKWGFTHMGRFAAYYMELFEQHPSQTLKAPYSAAEENIKDSCVGRQEEMI